MMSLLPSSISLSNSPHPQFNRRHPPYLYYSLSIGSFPTLFFKLSNFIIKTPSSSSTTGIRCTNEKDSTYRGSSNFLRKPALSESVKQVRPGKDVEEYGDKGEEEEEGWVDWEDQILEDTVPLVGFARMVLHSGKYESGDRLSPEHEKTIVERFLPYHPECDKKIGCGIDYITIGYHPNFESSRCIFIVRKDGEMVDFSYWKCIKGLIRKNYPLYADSFILRHFRNRRNA
ncbi:protein DCL, chloroplastic-like [Impatiens glandulifera]|uniref:protein DCL, chloroplastic-like n=1 Tax=Impatiens glandulifera TaxID=253017 RepID=UPI001FB19E3C|nr:protein DCL, chloroplastic-like [Impatiens glandulifera]